MAQLALKNIKKVYSNKNIVIENLHLNIHDREFVVLVGPSGCGKSTTLRMIAGLEDITDGEFLIDDKKMNAVSPGDRGVAMVFQDYALYPHMTVYENLAFGLRLKKNLSAQQIDKRIRDAAQILELEEQHLWVRPAQLSGGQRQRVAMGRAIVKQPAIFLFDEPLSNLDAQLRSKMRVEIKKLHFKFNVTSIYVTHDQLEAMTLADRLVIMHKGKIEQEGAPLEVFNRPRNMFVATFIGHPCMNLFRSHIEKKGDGLYIVGQGNIFEFSLPLSKQKHLQNGMDVIMGVRPADIGISPQGGSFASVGKTKGIVEVVEPLGKNLYVNLKIGAFNCVVDTPETVFPKVQEEISLNFNLDNIHLFDPKTELNLLFDPITHELLKEK